MQTYKKENKFFKILGIIYNIILPIIMIMYALSLLLPLIWMLNSTFKDELGLVYNMFGLPNKLYLKNYIDVWKFLSVKKFIIGKGFVNFTFFHLFYNTLIRSAVAPIVSIFFTTVCCYTLAKYKFKLNRFIYNLGLVLMVVPIVGTGTSTIILLKKLNIYDNLLASVIFQPACIFGMNFLILYAYFKTVPWAYAEAAFIDGASQWKVFLKIMLPMAFPTVFALYFLTFINNWNEYASVFTTLPSYPTIAYGVYMLQWQSSLGAEAATMPVYLTALTIVSIPCMVFWLISQKFVMDKVQVGGLKG